MRCVHCGQEHPESAKFCTVTGKKINQAAVCPQCGQAAEPGWVHCGYCGRLLSESNVAVLRPEPQQVQPAVQTRDAQPDLIKTAAQPRQTTWIRIVAGLAILLGLCSLLLFILINPPGRRTLPPTATIIPKVLIAPTENFTQPTLKRIPYLTATIIPKALPAPTENFTQPTLESTLSPEQAMSQAGDTFSNGKLVYLYQPQPRYVSLSKISAIRFSVNYLLAPNPVAIPAITVLNYVDLKGNKEFKMLWNPPSPDWKQKTGTLSFSLNPANDSLNQIFEQSGGKIQHVIPAYIEIVLMELVQKDNLNVLGSRALSNTVRIEIEK
jgi:hypothetical protein